MQAQILTAADLARNAPAIFATRAHESRKEHYGFVSTSEIIDTLAHDGWVPSYVGLRRARTEKSKLYGSHTLRLRRIDAPTDGEGIPEIVLRNGHDGSSAIVGRLGYFRFVCANGMVAGQTIAGFRIFHGRDALANTRQAVARLIERAPDMISQIDAMRAKVLSDDARTSFARDAIALRWPEGDAPVNANELLFTRRFADDGTTDVWTTANIIQEHLVRGGDRGMTSTRRRMTTRALSSQVALMAVNQGVWDLAVKYLSA